jgi:hypothetical protein
MAWQQSAAAGGSGGSAFSDDLTQVARLAGFVINSGWYVDGIQGIFQRCDGTPFNGPWHGGVGGTSHSIVNFAPSEYIVGITGSSGWYINQITIQTNLDTYGPYGQQTGANAWNVPYDNIGGFFGSAGSYLDKLGFFYPSCPGPQSNSTTTHKDK